MAPGRRAGRCCAPRRCRRPTTSPPSPTPPRCAPGCRSCTSSTASAPPTSSTSSRTLTTRTCARSSTTTDVLAFRRRGMTPDAPVLRGTAQNPDVFFQAREAANPFYDAVPGAVQDAMDDAGRAHRPPLPARRLRRAPRGRAGRGADGLGRRRGRGDRRGARRAAGSGRRAQGPPLPPVPRRRASRGPARRGPPHRRAGPHQGARRGRGAAAHRRAGGSPRRSWRGGWTPRTCRASSAAGTGCRPRSSPRRWSPACSPRWPPTPRRRRFTVGIHDDVTNLSLPPTTTSRSRGEGDVAAVFYGLGSDGTVGANKNTVKIVGEHTDLHAQGYFVYDSKKSGAVTVSHLRFSPEPIRSTYLIDAADFVACHQFGFLATRDVLESVARPGCDVPAERPLPAGRGVGRAAGSRCSRRSSTSSCEGVRHRRRPRRAGRGLGGRINTVMQPCFFALSGDPAADEAIAAVKDSIEPPTAAGPRGRRAATSRDRHGAGGAAEVPSPPRSPPPRAAPVRPRGVPDFVERVTGKILAGEGDLLPVSALPGGRHLPDRHDEVREAGHRQEIPIWDPTSASTAASARSSARTTRSR
jgi:pyruvate-ferredoxin/flavodoxin oxidoreductase